MIRCASARADARVGLRNCHSLLGKAIARCLEKDACYALTAMTWSDQETNDRAHGFGVWRRFIIQSPEKSARRGAAPPHRLLVGNGDIALHLARKASTARERPVLWSGTL